MTIERTLDDAHKLLRQGKVDGAIAAYAGVLEARPDDWPAANRLGDLYIQAGQVDQAVDQFTRVAQHLFDRHLLPKAAALYKKVLKVVPDDEYARLQLAEISERRGFMVEARAQLEAVVEQRRRGGDDDGVLEVEQKLRRLGSAAIETATPESDTSATASNEVDNWDVDRRLPFERKSAEQTGSEETAPPAAPTRPDPIEDAEPTAEARQLQLKLMLIENEIGAGRLKRARQLLSAALVAAPSATPRVVDLAKRMAAQGEPTVMCAEVLLDAAAQVDDWRSMTDAARDLAAWVPSQPDASQWSPDLLERLSRIEATARLETMRRESDEIREAFPDIASDASADTADDASPEPAVAAAV